MTLKEQIKKVKDLNSNLSSLSDNFNRIDYAAARLENFEVVKSLYLTENSEITILIGKGQRAADHPLITTDNQREVLDIVNLCEAIYTCRVEEALWAIEKNKTKIIEILQQ